MRNTEASRGRSNPVMPTATPIFESAVLPEEAMALSDVTKSELITLLNEADSTMAYMKSALYQSASVASEEPESETSSNSASQTSESRARDETAENFKKFFLMALGWYRSNRISYSQQKIQAIKAQVASLPDDVVELSVFNNAIDEVDILLKNVSHVMELFKSDLAKMSEKSVKAYYNAPASATQLHAFWRALSLGAEQFCHAAAIIRIDHAINKNKSLEGKNFSSHTPWVIAELVAHLKEVQFFLALYPSKTYKQEFFYSRPDDAAYFKKMFVTIGRYIAFSASYVWSGVAQVCNWVGTKISQAVATISSFFSRCLVSLGLKKPVFEPEVSMNSAVESENLYSSASAPSMEHIDEAPLASSESAPIKAHSAY